MNIKGTYASNYALGRGFSLGSTSMNRSSLAEAMQWEQMRSGWSSTGLSLIPFGDLRGIPFEWGYHGASDMPTPPLSYRMYETLHQFRMRLLKDFVVAVHEQRLLILSRLLNRDE